MSEFWSKIEAKVKSAAVASLVASLALAVLNATLGDSQTLGALPPWLQFLLITCGPTLATFISAWKTRHTAKAPVPVSTPAKHVA
jgi:hypothetical protein